MFLVPNQGPFLTFDFSHLLSAGKRGNGFTKEPTEGDVWRITLDIVIVIVIVIVRITLDIEV